MRVRDRLIEDKVAELIRKYPRYFSAPINVEKIVQAEGIRLVSKDFSGSVSGAAIVEGDVRIISYCESEHEHRQRFTIGHELGHHLLHRDQSLSVDIEPVAAASFFRDHESSTGEKWREVEANRFSAELLMPKELVAEAIAEIRETERDQDKIMQALAERFNVSLQAMCIRLGSLGYY